jgi:putative ABC transport system permease protein
VIGVIEDVSQLRTISYADIWVPYTTLANNSYRDQWLGSFNAVLLAQDRSALPQIREEFNARLARLGRAELPQDSDPYDHIIAPFETPFEAAARHSPFGERKTDESQGWKLLVALTTLGTLFALLPTVNLMNLNISRIMERASEIGVRKAFGASSRTLVAQFVVENVILTLVGGLVGLVLSVFVLRAFNEAGFVRHAQFGLNSRVFLYGLAMTVAFGIISGVYPAWRMSRLHPVNALKGGASR